MNLALQDKVIKKYMDEKGINDFIDCANEAECISIGAGHYLATEERANVYFSADGLCNALNFLTSWIIPEKIEMNIYVSTGRTEPPHKVMTDILPELLELLPYETGRLFIGTINK